MMPTEPRDGQAYFQHNHKGLWGSWTDSTRRVCQRTRQRATP
jgi:hypothetical protein